MSKSNVQRRTEVIALVGIFAALAVVLKTMVIIIPVTLDQISLTYVPMMIIAFVLPREGVYAAPAVGFIGDFLGTLFMGRLSGPQDILFSVTAALGGLIACAVARFILKDNKVNPTVRYIWTILLTVLFIQIICSLTLNTFLQNVLYMSDKTFWSLFVTRLAAQPIKIAAYLVVLFALLPVIKRLRGR